MVGEVNKIIYNMLISGRGVYLPQVGSLFIERQGAKRITKDKLLSPRNVVTYSTQEQAPSLVAEFVSVAGCTEEQAQDIYERWLAKTREGNTLTIGGVGVLNHRSFSIESAFGAAINPRGVKTLVIRRKSNTWLYVLCAVCVCIALGFFAYIMWGSKPVAKPAEQQSMSSLSPAAVDAATTVDSLVGADSNAAVQTPTTQTPALQPQGANVVAQNAADEAATAVGKSYEYYVVMGIFSSQQNADLAVEQVKSKIKDSECVILPFKNRFMVTVFGSNNRADCSAYAKSYKDIYPDLWVYNKK